MNPDDLNFLAPLIQTLGPAGLAGGIMYLWLKREQERNKQLEERNGVLQEKMDKLHESRAQEQATQIAVLQQVSNAIRAIPSMPFNGGPSGLGSLPPTSLPSFPPSYEPPLLPGP